MMKKLINLVLVLCISVSCFLFCGFTRLEDEARYGVDITPFSGALLGSETEYVYYSRRETEVYSNPYALPGYIVDGPDTCGPSGGAVVLGFFDRINEDLIPDQTAGRFLFNRWYYTIQSDVINNLGTELKTRMGHSTGGVTSSGFRTGLTSYVVDNGFSISLTSAMSGSALNISSLKNAVENEKLVTLFLNGFTVYQLNNIGTASGTDALQKEIYALGHVVIAFGYRIDRYYDANDSLLKEYTYLRTSTGFSGTDNWYVRLNERGVVNEAYVTNVY